MSATGQFLLSLDTNADISVPNASATCAEPPAVPPAVLRILLVAPFGNLAVVPSTVLGPAPIVGSSCTTGWHRPPPDQAWMASLGARYLSVSCPEPPICHLK